MTRLLGGKLWQRNLVSSPVHLVEQTPSSTMARRQGHGSYGPQLRDRKRGAVQEAKWLACRLCHFTNVSKIELGPWSPIEDSESYMQRYADTCKRGKVSDGGYLKHNLEKILRLRMRRRMCMRVSPQGLQRRIVIGGLYSAIDMGARAPD